MAQNPMAECGKPDFSRRRFYISDAGLAVDSAADGLPAARIEIAGLALAYDPEFARVNITDHAGTPVGVAIGYPYFSGHGYPADDSIVQLDGDCSTAQALERAVLAIWSGPSVLILFGRSPPTLYLSPGGEMPIVYDPAAKRAGSTTEMLLDADGYAARFDHGLYEKSFAGNATEGWIIGDRTAHHGVFRLLPNHALDLHSWQARRHWPMNAADIGWVAGDDVIAGISARLQAFCAASAARFNLFVALTAGVDTRLVAAACQQVRDQIELYTIFAPSASTAYLDTTVARNIAQGMGIRHRQLHSVSGTAADGEAWDRAVGHCTRHPNRLNFRILDQFPADAAIASGLFGEVGCGWPYEREPLTINDRQIDARQIVLRLKCPDDPEIVADVERWMQPLLGYPPSIILDLAYWELRMGGWSCGQRPAQGALRVHLSPIAQRPILEQFVRLRPAEKADDAFVIRCLNAMWPELMQWRFNRFGDYRDLLTPLRKLTSPGRLRQFLRTLRAGFMARKS